MANVDFETFLSSVCHTIKKLRKEKGLSQGAVAEKLAKAQSMVARFESGNINDSHVSFIFHMCQAIEEDIGNVMSLATSAILVEERHVGNDLNSRWETLKEKIEQLKNPQKKELLGIVEGIFRLM